VLDYTWVNLRFVVVLTLPLLHRTINLSKVGGPSVNRYTLLIEVLRGMVSKLGARGSALSSQPGQSHRKLNRGDVLRLIVQHGGPQGLDLSGFDLSGVDLSGTKLQRTVFGKHKHGSANLQGAFLHGANLEGADLAGTNLQGANLHDAVLRGAALNWANFQNADLRGSDLTRATLFRARLEGADLSNASLNYANLHLAFLGNTRIDREELGSSILQENLEEYRRHLERTSERLRTDVRVEQHLAQSASEARDVYLALKNNFRSIGQYDDASWAYIKERQMERTTYAPWCARRYHGANLPQGCGPWSWRWWWFHLKCGVKWLFDWAAELSCCYGERPWRTVGWSASILHLFPLLYYLSGGLVSEAGLMSRLDYFNYSLAAFSTIGFSQFQAVTPLAQTLTSIESLLGISLLALLMFTLGNRISRS
jgi:uncharacterized protein YjbI with pentapeptide repeats